jgi:3'-5' exoribonuclease
MNILKPGDSVNHYFVVMNTEEKLTKSGKTYLDLQVRNRYIHCSTKIWDWENVKQMYFNLEAGGYVKLVGIVEEFAGSLQIKFQDMILFLEDEIDMTHILEVPHKPLEEMKNELWRYIHMIQNVNLKELCACALDTGYGLWKAFYTKPAASKYHHATQHGLIEHTVSMMGLAVKIQKHYPFLSLDLLLAGCLWHDIGKTVELNDVLKGGYTIEGQLIGHMNLAITLIDQILVSERTDVINTEDIMLLKHIILSHHGKPEWGSTVKPAIPEAEALHMIDKMDATFYRFFRHMKDAPVGEWVSDSTLSGRYLKHSLHEMVDKDYYRS